MLSHIHIRNLAIVDAIDVELGAGMTTLTGETGAGKSILVDALGLVLGDRADSAVIRHGCERAEISAGFDISGNPGVAGWLQERDLDADGDCLLRRVISREGRSRGYINGQPATMQLLRELGEQLVDIHGQHEHQSLLRTTVQREQLDAFGGHRHTLDRVASLHAEWQATQERLNAAITDDRERDARIDLLRYQLQELAALGLTTAEIEALGEEHARQANAGRLMSACQQGLQSLDAEDAPSAAALVGQAHREFSELAAVDAGLEEVVRVLGEAVINIQEGISLLRHYSDRLEIDPQRLQWLEERLALLHDLARKHGCRANELPAIEQQLQAELGSLEHADEQRAALTEKLAGLEAAWRDAADELSRKRIKAAGAFSREITAAMQTLGMVGGEFEATVSRRPDGTPATHGQDDIVFQVSANKGQPLQPLARVASGGELSRISLSVQVISAGSETIPTLIFDEVDSGIGGSVAEIVGRKLRALAGGRQVLCVTHLPQVAALAHQQLLVTKHTDGDTTHTRVTPLDEDRRIEELARMLGGVKITRQTREHAREMMHQADAGQPARRRRRNSKASA